MKKLIVFLLVIVAASSVMFTKAAHSNELVTGDMNNTKSFSENFQTTGEVSSASGPIITNVGLTIGNDGKKDFSYLRREGNEWVRVTRSKEGINILGKEPAPREQIPAGHTSCLFLPYVAHPVGSWPEAVAIGDVNGDGKNDVVMTTSYYFDPNNDYRLFVFLQNASGGLEPPVKYPAGNGESVAIGDVNNDGKNDVVVTASNSVGVFYQNNSGGLNPMVTYASHHSSFSNTYKVRIGDFNNDGLLDVVSIDWGTQSLDVDVYLQNAGGTLHSPVAYSVTHGGYDDLEVGDVNHDGRQDVIVMSGQDIYPSVGILLQRSDGTFGSPVYYDITASVLTHGVAVGDISGDGLEDIVVTYGGNSPNAFIGTFLQNSLGTLNSNSSYSSYDFPEPVEIRDVNSDGRNDVIVAHGGWNALGVYLQGNAGTLLSEELSSIPYASHYNPHGIAVGDINGDGLNDVAIADYINGLVLLYHTPSGILYSLSGTVTGDVKEGVTITLTGPVSMTTLTDAAGNYSASGLERGTYTVTPSKSGYTFTPANKAVDISCANQSGVNFTATEVFHAGTVNLPETGQAKCYNSAGGEIPCDDTGQDGALRAGVPWPVPRFEDNGDGTVTDNLTGLMWTKSGNTPGSGECDPGGNKTFQQALEYVACLNTTGYLGYTDWRHPNINELESLVNAGEANVTTWLNDHGFSNVQPSMYGSSTTCAYHQDWVWAINIWEGALCPITKSTSGYYVWPVRSGEISGKPAPLWKTGQSLSYACGDDGDLRAGVPWPVPRFEDNGDGTVTDNLTGLMWTTNANAPGPNVCSPGTKRKWQQALDYVACLNSNRYLGYSDWRLPNRKELHSLTDFSQYNPALPLQHPFTDTSAAFYYWTSTSYVPGSANAWMFNMANGDMYGTGKEYNDNNVWPVRGGQVGPSYTLSVTKSDIAGGTVTSSPAGIDCGQNCSAQFAQGTVVTLTATTYARFTGWSGVVCDTSANPTKITMNDNYTVGASFGCGTCHGKYRISMSTTGAGNVTSSPAGIDCGVNCNCTAEFNQGTIVTLTATPGSGQRFINWSGATCDLSANSMTIALYNDYSIEAKFSGCGGCHASSGHIMVAEERPTESVFNLVESKWRLYEQSRIIQIIDPVWILSWNDSIDAEDKGKDPIDVQEARIFDTPWYGKVLVAVE